MWYMPTAGCILMFVNGQPAVTPQPRWLKAFGLVSGLLLQFTFLITAATGCQSGAACKRSGVLRCGHCLGSPYWGPSHLTYGVIMKILALVLALFASPVVAQSCAPADEVAGLLLERWGETVQVTGESAQGPIVIFANPTTGSWTMAGVMGDTLCMLTGGTDWQNTGTPSGEPV